MSLFALLAAPLFAPLLFSVSCFVCFFCFVCFYLCSLPCFSVCCFVSSPSASLFASLCAPLFASLFGCLFASPFGALFAPSLASSLASPFAPLSAFRFCLRACFPVFCSVRFSVCSSSCWLGLAVSRSSAAERLAQCSRDRWRRDTQLSAFGKKTGRR
jgi:hypothetical protein